MPKIDAPFACNVEGFSPSERTEHRALAARLFGSVVKTGELADGYEFELDPSRFSVVDIIAWLAFERRCCPFFDIGFEWRRDRGPLMLHLTGRDGVKEFIRAEFHDHFR